MTLANLALQFSLGICAPSHYIAKIMISAGLAILEVIIVTKKHSRMFIIDLCDHTMRLVMYFNQYPTFGQQALNTLDLLALVEAAAEQTNHPGYPRLEIC